MSAEEVAAITVPFSEIRSRLASVVEAHGVAVIPDLATVEECREFERLFSDDLREVLDGPRVSPMPDVQLAVAEAHSQLSQPEKAFLKSCKDARAILKLEGEKREGKPLDGNQEQKLGKKEAVLKDVMDRLGSLAKTSDLRQKNEDVIRAAVEVTGVPVEQMVAGAAPAIGADSVAQAAKGKGKGKGKEKGKGTEPFGIRKLSNALVRDLCEQNRCSLYGMPQGRFAWEARLHPRVREAYSLLHGTDRLVVGCDNTFFSPGAEGEGWRHSNKSWPHVDHNMYDRSIQGSHRRSIGEWEVYQSILYVWPSTDEAASTTVVWTGSHKDVFDRVMQQDDMQRQGRKGIHFAQLREPDLIAGWHKAARRVPVPAGGLLLWSSRTVHQGWSAGPRLAQPICWEPEDRRSEEAMWRKFRMAVLGFPSTHWASLGYRHQMRSLTTRLEEAKKMKALRPVTLVGGVSIDEAMWQQLSEADWRRSLPIHLQKLLRSLVAERYIGVL